MTRPFPALMDRVRPRDAIDLMAWPCFALGKQRRLAPIAYAQRGRFLRVTPTSTAGLATIWDADILIWAVSQLAEGKDRHLVVSPELSVSGLQLLRFLGRSTGQTQYRALHAALERLRTSEVETNVGIPEGAPVRFRWIERWERQQAALLIVVPDWLFVAIVERRRMVRVDPSYFRLTGGIDRWLWRLLHRHGNRKSTGWSIALSDLHARSGSLARQADFCVLLRRAVRRLAASGVPVAIVRSGSTEHLHHVQSTDRIHSANEVLVHNAGFHPQNVGRGL
ncbi:replication initiator protein A [Nguyenibacter vanlangensis]|uniref:Replication initiator protein A n=1 Tax=Nguyenibacter vanlangensis TaxID=1216886 RepID=A0ABZ3DAB3_9PROT